MVSLRKGHELSRSWDAYPDPELMSFLYIGCTEYNISMKKETKELLSPLFTILGFGIFILAIIFVSFYIYITKPHLDVYDTSGPNYKDTFHLLVPSILPNQLTTTAEHFNIVGSTLPKSQVYIGSEVITSNLLGEFKKTISLSDGKNTVIIKAVGLTHQSIITRSEPVPVQESPQTTISAPQTKKTNTTTTNNPTSDNSPASNEKVKSNSNMVTTSSDLVSTGPIEMLSGSLGLAAIIMSMFIYRKSKSNVRQI